MASTTTSPRTERLGKAAFNRLYDQYYYHRHNDFWGQQAMKKLPQLTQSTRMLVCGEDLGMIPDCVAWVMNDLRILSLEIQRMPKDPKQEFGHTDWYPAVRSAPSPRTTCYSCAAGGKTSNRRSVTTTPCSGTTVLHRQRPMPELCEEVVRNHLHSNSIPCIPLLQDWMSMDGRTAQVTRTRRKNASIFLPTPQHYLALAHAPDTGTTEKAESLNEKIRSMIESTGKIRKDS